MEVLSPELVLIDGDLAAEARAALAEPPDVFDALALARAGDTVRRLRVSFNAQEAEAAAEAEGRRRRLSSRQRFAGAAILAAGALAALAAAVETLGRDEVTTARALASNTPAKTRRQTASTIPAPKPVRATRTAARRHAHASTAKAKPAPARARHPVPAPRPTVPVPRRASAVGAKPAHTAATAPTPAQAVPKVGTAAVRPQPTPVLTWPVQRRATYYRVAVYRLGRSPGFLFEVWTDKTRLPVPATWGAAAEHNRLAPGAYGWAVFPAFGALGEAPADRAAAAPITGGRFTV